jgi:diguanylate cyclase (GGDEF)-like protein/putative nucleotidyltransferase with HDIG domain
VVLAIAVAALAWGVVSLRLIDWRTAAPVLIHISTTTGFVVIAVVIASTGGCDSPGWIYLYFIVVLSSWLYAAPVASAYMIGCAVTMLLPLLYDGRATRGPLLGECMIAVPSFFVLSGAIVAGRGLLSQSREQAERLAAEQGALRRVATAVADGDSPEEIYALVAEEAAHLLDASASGILRFESETRATVIGSWSQTPNGRYWPGTPVDVAPGSDSDIARRTGQPVRIDEHAPGSPVVNLGYACSVVAPVNVGGNVWGILAATHERPGGLPRDAEARLLAFGDLLATAISNTIAQATLAARASTDPLTGLANHRSFHERLAVEVRRAVRYGRPLSVAVIDVDHFKQVNDHGGHELGDKVLNEIGACLATMTRADDTLARIGGDEFAWLLPETDRAQAFAALERARRTVANSQLASVPVTISAGICDTLTSQDPQQLYHLADGALYWGKVHGRNVCWIYDPEVVHDLSAQERAEHLQRSQALLGLRALARAIDAKDPTTRRHSERVSDLAAKLALQVGWAPERVLLLSEAALVHDVGKIGVPDAVLLKDGQLDADEYEQIKQHAELGALIVEDVLLPEQVEWVRSHHERPDGLGYPNGLEADEIPEGASLLAVADAWDVMTLSRPYSAPKLPDEAVAECTRLVGVQFTAAAVAALARLHADGELTVGREPAAENPATV